MSSGRIVILAAGMSSRMKNSAAEGIPDALQREAERLPKTMIPVGRNGRPFLDFLLKNVFTAGYRDVVIVTNEKDETIRAYYGNDAREDDFPGLRFTFAVQRIPEGRTTPLGTADAVHCGLLARPEWAGGYCTICNGDNLYSVHALRTMNDDALPSALVDYDRDALLFAKERALTYAVIDADEQGYLRQLIEKPTPEQAETLEQRDGRVGVSMNLYRLNYTRILSVMESLPVHPIRNEKELPMAVTRMLERFPQEVKVIRTAEHVPDLTSKSDLSVVREYLEKEFPGF